MNNKELSILSGENIYFNERVKIARLSKKERNKKLKEWLKKEVVFNQDYYNEQSQIDDVPYQNV